MLKFLFPNLRVDTKTPNILKAIKKSRSISSPMKRLDSAKEFVLEVTSQLDNKTIN